MDNEGTKRLVTAAIEKANEALEDYEYTQEERENRRRRNIERGCFKGGYNGPRRWKPEQLALIGTAPDDEVAARIGKTPKAVQVMRKRLGIPIAVDRRLQANRS
jgi:hypothetical protein